MGIVLTVEQEEAIREAMEAKHIEEEAAAREDGQALIDSDPFHPNT